jgi:hypothetical protein
MAGRNAGFVQARFFSWKAMSSSSSSLTCFFAACFVDVPGQLRARRCDLGGWLGGAHLEGLGLAACCERVSQDLQGLLGLE